MYREIRRDLFKTDPSWVVYNLVTKHKYWQKPTRHDLFASLDLLVAQMRANGERKLALPLLVLV